MKKINGKRKAKPKPKPRNSPGSLVERREQHNAAMPTQAEHVERVMSRPIVYHPDMARRYDVCEFCGVPHYETCPTQPWYRRAWRAMARIFW